MKIRIGFVSNSSSSSFIISDTELDKIKEANIDEIKLNDWAEEMAHDDVKYYDKDFNESYRKYKNKYREQFDRLKLDVIGNEFKNYSLQKFLENFKYEDDFAYYLNERSDKARNVYNFYNMGDYFKKDLRISKHMLYNLQAQFLKILEHRSFKSFYSWFYAIDLTVDKKLYVGRMFRRDKTRHHLINRHRKINKHIKEVRLKKFKEIDKLSNRKKFLNFLNFLIREEFNLSDTWSSNSSWLRQSKDQDLKDIRKFLKLFDTLLYNLSHQLYQVIIDENKDNKFYQKEYSDGGGCGDTLPLAECSLLFEDTNVKYIRISHH